MLKKIIFLQRSFCRKKGKGFVPCTCPRCDKFLVNSREKKLHNFIRHYNDGKTLHFENRPVFVSRIAGVVVYTINYESHNEFYNFFDPVKLIKKKINVFIHKFVPKGKKVQINCTFYIINF